MIKASPSVSDGSGVGQHADCRLDLGKITSGYDGWGLVVDTNLETSGTPVDKLDGAFSFDGCDGSIDILGDNIASVQETAGHVLSMTGIAFDHLVGGFETGIGDLSNRKLFMVSFLR